MEGTQDLDSAIIASFPNGGNVVSIVPHGKTRWSVGLRIEVERDDGKKEVFFLKIIERKEWVGMAEAEYEGQKALFEKIPDNVTAPLAWGMLQADPTKSFFLTRFRNLLDSPPPVVELLTVLKKLHIDSVSPTAKFGFHVTTYFGPPPMINDWTDSWEEYFGRQFHADMVYVQQVFGADPELVDLTEEFVDKVVARLLRPLQTGGRRIKPSLCHGDLWDGNVQIDADTQQPIIFDAACFYGHSEMDLQCMGDSRYALGMDFIDSYKKEVGASEPVEDFNERHELYALSLVGMRCADNYALRRCDFVVAALAPQQWAKLLEPSKEHMKQMIARYPGGYGDFQEGFGGDSKI
ncbi:Fructosamine kinase-domain-containing protein [Apiospora arundinis]|uniref:protein-ribulosamine 3-kinase n=1 Tax=Apiospora arundinis TaxID=335852 RepID=A0ABR2HK55_9PEZI